LLARDFHTDNNNFSTITTITTTAAATTTAAIHLSTLLLFGVFVFPFCAEHLRIHPAERKGLSRDSVVVHSSILAHLYSQPATPPSDRRLLLLLLVFSWLSALQSSPVPALLNIPPLSITLTKTSTAYKKGEQPSGFSQLCHYRTSYFNFFPHFIRSPFLPVFSS
jgi:hypothetical protein